MVRVDSSALSEVPLKRAKYSPFGLYIINTQDLSKHIVNIKYAKNNTSIPSLPKVRDVDKEVIAILFHLIDTGELNQPLMDGLGKADYEFLANLLFKCGLRRMIKTNRQAGPSTNVAKRRDFWLHRYRVLHGELSAGNDSTELFVELKERVIPGLYDSGAVSEERYHELQTKLNEILNTS
jgi:hypothetical protein